MKKLIPFLLFGLSTWNIVAVTNQAFILRVPLSLESSGQRAYIASQLVQGIGDYATNGLTNVVMRSPRLVSPVITNGVLYEFTDIAGNLSVSGVFTNTAIFGGSASNIVLNTRSNLNLYAGESDGSDAELRLWNTNSGDYSFIRNTQGGVQIGNSDSARTYDFADGDLTTGGFYADAAINSHGFNGLAQGLTNASPKLATNSLTAANGDILMKSGDDLKLVPIYNITKTNQNFNGTNNFPQGADVAFSRYPITSLATGNNAGVVVSTNVFIEVGGPSGAFTINGIANGRDGKLIYIINQTGQDMTIAHQSGTDPVAANRIITMTGADRATTGNGAATLIYSGAASRWLLIGFDP